MNMLDALLAQLCLRRDLTMLTADKDFVFIAEHCGLRLWVTAQPVHLIERME